MKIRDVRAVLVEIATSHERLFASESAAVLREFGEAIKQWDEQTVAAFVKLTKGSTGRPTKR
jgi:hypothetical protein